MRRHRRHFPDGKQLADFQFRRAPADFRVRRRAVRAQFVHVAQHRHAPALQRQIAQRFQRGKRRIRVGIVGVVQHTHAVRFPKLQPHFWRLAFGQAALDFSAAQSEPLTDRHGKKRIHHLMTSEQFDPILAAKFFFPCRGLERHAVFIQPDFFRAPVDLTIAALETLCDLPLQGRRAAVLGDMEELGAHSAAAHAEVGRRAAELKIGQLFAVGKMAPVTAKAARNAGLTRVIEFADVEAAVKALKSFLKAGDVVLLKASRLSRLERIAETLKSEKS